MPWKTGALIVLLAVASPGAAGRDITPPAVPLNLQVPEGHVAFLVTRAEGTQNYVCLPTSSGFMWTFFGPQATLFDENNAQILTHYLGANPAENGTLRPAWQHSQDTSAVWAAPIASSTDPAFVASGAIPWLLLRVMGAQYGPTLGDTLVPTVFIQRVNTAGGVAPTAGCKSAKDTGRKALVPYTTDYVFYKASN